MLQFTAGCTMWRLKVNEGSSGQVSILAFILDLTKRTGLVWVSFIMLSQCYTMARRQTQTCSKIVKTIYLFI